MPTFPALISEASPDARTDRPVDRLPEVVLEPKPEDTGERKGVGGTHTHKEGCRCRPCKARRRKEEAVPGPTGIGGDALVPQGSQTEALTVLDADAPITVDATGNRAKNSNAKIRVRAWLQVRALEPMLTIAAIAQKIGVAPRTLYRDISVATKEGWVKFEDPLERIDFQIIPKTLDNLNHFLDEKDKTVTIETAKATIFKTYQNSKGISDAPLMALSLKIEQPDVANERIVTGHIIGRPKVIESGS